MRCGCREYTSMGWKSWWWVEGEEERQGCCVQVHIGEGVPEQCVHSMRSRYDYRKPSRNYFLYIENARGSSSPSFLQKLPPLSFLSLSAPFSPFLFPPLSRRSLDHATTFFHTLSVVLLTEPELARWLAGLKTIYRNCHTSRCTSHYVTFLRSSHGLRSQSKKSGGKLSLIIIRIHFFFPYCKYIV